MKLFGVLTLTLAMVAVPPTADGAETRADDPSTDPLSTERRVHGVITSVDASTLAIATSQKTVIGRIDPTRTKVTVRGRPARASDLELTAHAKAELCLDDVWLRVDVH
jgi:hypothetical protein